MNPYYLCLPGSTTASVWSPGIVYTCVSESQRENENSQHTYTTNLCKLINLVFLETRRKMNLFHCRDSELLRPVHSSDCQQRHYSYAVHNGRLQYVLYSYVCARLPVVRRSYESLCNVLCKHCQRWPVVQHSDLHLSKYKYNIKYALRIYDRHKDFKDDRIRITG